MKTGTKTMKLIRVRDIPRERFGTYLRIVAAFRPEKGNPRRIQFTAEGNLVVYPRKTSTKATDITTVKLLINSTLSTPNVKFVTANLVNFYLETPMEQREFIRIPLKVIPPKIMKQYKSVC